jgi:hypothetical protein
MFGNPNCTKFLFLECFGLAESLAVGGEFSNLVGPRRPTRVGRVD